MTYLFTNNLTSQHCRKTNFFQDDLLFNLLLARSPGRRVNLTMHVPIPAAKTIYRAAVIGAGPSGLACVGNLLDHLAPDDRVLWIDPVFRAGRLESYPRVPSNTKVCLFTKFALDCKSFEAEKCSKTLKALQNDFDPQRGCELSNAADLCQELTDHIYGKVDSIKGFVKELKHQPLDNFWTVKTDTGDTFHSKLVFLTTGSRPKRLQGEPSIHLDEALNPEILNKKIRPSDRVAVYGSSHSAMLVLKNLLSIPNSPASILNYYRQPAKFASFPDPIHCPDKILHDNTGLKGETAEWVRSWIDLGERELDEMFGGKLKRINTSLTEGDAAKTGNVVNIYAVGYEPNPLPSIIYNSVPLTTTHPPYNPSGQLFPSQTTGLYGFGIAFPERVKDLDGSEEAAVGMWKFMRHIKKCVKQIISE